MNVFAYIRVSGKSQVSGDGPERQRDSIRKFCEAQELTCVGEFFEEGVSGTVEGLHRPAFFSMLEAANQLKPVGFVVERMDRLARDLMVSEMILNESRSRGLKVFAADQGAMIDMAAVEGVDPTRILLRQFLAAIAQWEKTNLVLKLRAARERSFANGNVHALGPVPFGFANEPEKLVLKMMLDLWDSFAYKSSNGERYVSIAESLNLCGLTNRAGGRWTRHNIYQILKRYWKRKKQNYGPAL